jgi:glycosyltransferase involved in cell wall biosynthesis
VHPSKFEGLGLPPVEAFQRGVPVLASTAACIPEVVGDAALAFDPDDVDAITAALKRAVEEPELLAELQRRGSARVDAFFPAPATLARMFATVYRKAAGAPLDAAGEALLTEMTA